MDASMDGRSAEPFEFVVETGKIREFARATKSSNAEYFNERPISPPTFLVVADLWAEPRNDPFLLDPDQPLDWTRGVHGEQEFVFHGAPPRAGDRLVCVARIERVYEKEGRRGGSMTFIEVVREFRDAVTDALVADARTTVIETTSPIGSSTTSGRQALRTNVQVGDAGTELIDGPLTVTDFVRYQGASGDRNPMHHDARFAQRAGYSGPFAVGMRQAGVLATYATDWLGPRNIRRFKVRFDEIAWPDDIITYRGRIVEKREVGDECLVDLELFATRQTGGIHLRGWATFVDPAAHDV